MQTINFTKMQGIGNDYVYVDCTGKMIENPGEVSKFVSDRHFGIGSDGLILICASDVADFQMVMFNSDGTRAEMCGNGIRCVGKYVYDHRMTDKNVITVETLAGIKTLKFDIENDLVSAVTVDMGAPILTPKDIPVASDIERFIAQPTVVDGIEWNITAVSMGNPHAIIFTDGIENMDLPKIGPLFEHHELFPARVNTEFVEVIDRKHLKMRVWERGAGETLACGTGACAVLTAAVLNNLAEREADVELLGGTLHIRWSEEDGHVYMTGPAETVFEGTISV